VWLLSVKAGKSISIPCLYESQYKNHVKYLCEGYYWTYCSDAVKTNKPDPSGKYSISDDKKDPNVFTVTMSGLRTKDSGWYWCAKGDIQIPVYLTVTEKPITSTTTAVSSNSNLRIFRKHTGHLRVHWRCNLLQIHF
uniref:Immunoglobulin V-set domain-containing protein n=1 Tax=Oreochromis aureus TaxID=47969 RepID=A0AAZ1XWM2_OREAU